MLTESILDKLFNPVFNTTFDSTCNRNEDGQVEMEIEVPGFNKDSLNVEISEGILTVSGKTEKRQIYKQYQLGNIEDVQATIKDGILTLTLVETQAQVKKIELNTPQIEDKTDNILDAVS